MYLSESRDSFAMKSMTLVALWAACVAISLAAPLPPEMMDAIDVFGINGIDNDLGEPQTEALSP